MYCEKCGTKVEDGAKFCPGCGAEVNGAEGVSSVSSKSRTAALLFGIFFGHLGVHNFYLGQIGRGVTKLVLSVCGIGGYVFAFFKLFFKVALTIEDETTPLTSGMPEMFAGAGFALILLAITGIWAFVEWVIIACGKARDSKGLLVSKW